MSEVRQAACALLLRSGEHDATEVYLVRRSPQLPLLGGFHVFPGGTIDPSDERLAQAWQLPEPRLVTAARELFEETGVLALRGAEGLSAPELEAARRKLLQGHDWSGWLREHGLTLQPSDWLPMGEWVTPPYTPTIYAAEYYAVWLPPGQTPQVWDGELVSGAWWTVENAVAAHHRGELFISYPVLETLEVMRRTPSLQDASREMESRRGRPAPFGGEILRGAHVLPVKTFTLPPATHTNCYFIGGREMVIVDPATPLEAEQDRLLTYAAELQRRGIRLVEIWLTHHHKDHVGAVERLRKELDLPVAAHAETARLLAGEVTVDRLMADGDTREFTHAEGPPTRWRAVHTPGHAPGHLCFYEERSGTLISGDNVVGLGTVIIAPPEGNMVQYFESLYRMRELARGFMLPAHGPPIATPVEKIDFYLAHRRQREESIYQSLAEGPLSPREIVHAVYTDTDPRAFPLAEINVRAHLEKLEAEGRVHPQGDRWAQDTQAR